MKNMLASVILPGALTVLGIVALAMWINTGPIHDLQARVPGLDRPQMPISSDIPAVPLVGQLTTREGVPSDLPGAWPCFRGENRNGIAGEGIRLAREWPDQGPDPLWSLDLGEGYAGAAVRAGRVYLLDYDREASADALRCLSLDDGREIWCYRYPVALKRNHGMSRTVPAVTDKYVVSLGPKCQVTCLDAVTGQCHWMLDLVREYGTTVPQWYAGQCPLIDSGRAILAPGGDALLIAVDCASGEPVWKSPNPRAWKMTHSSISPMELGGRRMYVYCGKGGVAGISADDGSILWETTDWKISIATCPSPVILPDGKIFLCGGYNSGALMLQVTEKDGRFVAQTLFRLEPSRFGSKHHTPILLDAYIYGIREQDEQLACLDLEGNQLWASGSQHRFGAGPYLIADGLIYVMDDTGLLTMAEATPDGYKQLAQAQVLHGHDAWGPMAMAAGRLIVREFTRMVCLNVAEELVVAGLRGEGLRVRDESAKRSAPVPHPSSLTPGS